jgi:hypothetical protein
MLGGVGWWISSSGGFIGCSLVVDGAGGPGPGCAGDGASPEPDRCDGDAFLVRAHFLDCVLKLSKSLSSGCLIHASATSCVACHRPSLQIGMVISSLDEEMIVKKFTFCLCIFAGI